MDWTVALGRQLEGSQQHALTLMRATRLRVGCCAVSVCDAGTAVSWRRRMAGGSGDSWTQASGSMWAPPSSSPSYRCPTVYDWRIVCQSMLLRQFADICAISFL